MKDVQNNGICIECIDNSKDVFTKMIKDVKFISGIYVAAVMITSLIMRDFSLKHTAFLLIAAILIDLQDKIYKYPHNYKKNVFVLLGGMFSAFIVKWWTPGNIKIWDVDTYIAFTVAFVNLGLLFLSIFKHKHIRNILAVPIVFLYTIPLLLIWGNYFSEHAWINADAIVAIMQTNPSEALDYLRDRMGIKLLVFFVILGVVFYLLHGCVRNLVIKKSRKNYILIFVVVILNLTLLVRTNDNFVTWAIHEACDYQESYQEYVEAKLERHNKISNNYSFTDKGDKGIYVLVIGESETRKHLSAYGYDRETTPWLDKMKNQDNVVLFSNAYSCYCDTGHALPYVLTAKNQYNNMELKEAVSIIDVAKAAGFQTVWLSNQVKFSGWDNPITVISDEADQQIRINSHIGNTLDTDYYDGELVNRLDDIKYSDKMLIVIHLMGSHLSYHNRYPVEFDKFSGEGYLSEYDNSVYYTDYVINKIVDKLSQKDDFRSLIYISDHGEGIDKNLSHNSANFVYDMIYIPFYMYFSSNYMNENREKVAMLKTRRNDYFTNDLIFNTVLGVMSIRVENIYEPVNDLTNSMYDGDVDRFLTMYGTRKISDDPERTLNDN